MDELRAAGLAMGGRYAPRTFVDPETDEERTSTLYIGWTTDRGKADAARELGATVLAYQAHDPACSGWEVSVSVIA